MEQLSKNDISEILLTAAKIMKKNCDYLSEIDSKFGDGDHGISVNKITEVIEKCVGQWAESSLYDFLYNLGDSIMQINGGSAGPLWGTLFQGFAVPLKNYDYINAMILKKMLNEGLNGMKEITTAKVGDKTMMDALFPAVDSAVNAENDILSVLRCAANGAREGMECSKLFVAKYGRAKSYGSQTINTPDAGAVSTALLFQGLLIGYQSISQREDVKL